MANHQLIINARLPGFNALQNIELDTEHKITAITPKTSGLFNINNQERVIDLQGDWLSLGGIDLQINGGLGLAFNALEFKDLAKIREICQFLWLQGIDGFLPTIVTTSIEKIRRSLSVIAQFIQTQENAKNTALVLGVHLEGPFLNYEKRGAHPAEYLLPLTIDNIQKIFDIHGEIVKIITLAPELDTTKTAINYLIGRGIVVSLGHSLATEEQAQMAFKLGASMVTHGFNAMPSLHHRQPGLLGAAIVNPDIYCGLIADGNHVCPTMIKILLHASNYDRGVFLVSDALAPIGLPDGVYPWDARKIIVTDGTAKLPDGTLSGTTLPLLTGVNNLVEWGICDLEQAIALATEAPRKAIALSGLKVGQPAQFVHWHWNETQNKLTWKRLNLKN
ncbi:MAG: N-acetylglucosamine-6-phosphate deacetylase [Pleurocapsa sp.]